MIALMKYHFKTYFKSSKFIMPLAIYLIFMVMMCGGAINDATSIFVISIVASYFLMVWSAFVFTDCEELIAEQIAVLKAGSNKKYYLSKNLFIIMWGLLYAVLGIAIPSLWKIISVVFKMGEFKNFTVLNIIIAFLIHICVCALGAAVGFLWHPRIMANRKIAAIGAFSFGVMGIINGPLAEEFAVVGFIKWLFPPIYFLLEKIGMGAKAFIISDAFIPMVLCLAYAAILVVINVIVLHKKGF